MARLLRLYQWHLHDKVTGLILIVTSVLMLTKEPESRASARCCYNEPESTRSQNTACGEP